MNYNRFIVEVTSVAPTRVNAITKNKYTSVGAAAAWRRSFVRRIQSKRLFLPRRQAKQLDLKTEFFQLNSKAEIDLMPGDHSAGLILKALVCVI
ncbi:MAG: hypothetical protein PHD43_23280 [Methylococcales bacterium]|nr:hypothetical protein [Methylococcales bacterium]